MPSFLSSHLTTNDPSFLSSPDESFLYQSRDLWIEILHFADSHRSICNHAERALARFAALIINGHYHRTPILRALTAALGAALWGFMAALFYRPESGAISTGCGVYLVLAGSDCFSAWRSGRDAMIAWTIYDEGRCA